MEIKQNYPLSQLTTFRIGGPALYMGEVASEADLKQALDFAQTKKLPVLVLGGGSNVLASDQGFNGLVIHNQIKRLSIEDNGRIVVGAGERWDDVAAMVVQKGLAGIECLSGVPGSAGGAVVQNIGAYGQTIGDVVSKVSAIEVKTGKVKEFTPEECKFEYRNSWFKRNPNQYVITEFELQLQPNGAPNISFPEIKKEFEGKNPTLPDVREQVIKARASKGTLIMPQFESYQTAGSFFKNPIIPQDQFEKMKAMFGDSSLNRFWEQSDGVKLSAAFLIQEAGFGKGYREGNVGISPKHALALINYGNAKAMDIKALASKIKQAVNDKFGVSIEEEVLYI